MKTIFNTTEKSNFILNMPAETLRKYIRNLLVICVILPFIGGFFWLFTDKAKYLGASLLTLSGFTSVLIFIVALLKKDVIFHKNISYIILVALMIFAAVTAAFALDSSIGIYGKEGRNEGVLAILSYGGLFLLGSLISKKEDVKFIFDTLIFIGILQCIISLLQHFQLFDFPTGFKNLYSIAVENCFLPEGTSGSPIFFATFLTLVSGIAMAGVCYEKQIKKLLFYFAALILFALNALFTSSIIPLIGIPLAFITICIIEFIRIIKNKIAFQESIFLNPILKLLIIALSFGLIFVAVLMVEGITIRDKAIAFEDSFYKLFISGSLTRKLQHFYTHTWGGTIDIIKMYPFIGTGPDCLYIPQMDSGNLVGTPNLFDKSYNDYLYTAATRGIPSLILYLSLLGVTIKRTFGGIKQFFSDSENWYKIALLASILSYAVVMFFGVSTVLVAPYFWIMLGIANSKKLYTVTNEKKKK